MIGCVSMKAVSLETRSNTELTICTQTDKMAGFSDLTRLDAAMPILATAHMHGCHVFNEHNIIIIPSLIFMLIGMLTIIV